MYEMGNVSDNFAILVTLGAAKAGLVRRLGIHVTKQPAFIHNQ